MPPQPFSASAVVEPAGGRAESVRAETAQDRDQRGQAEPATHPGGRGQCVREEPVGREADLHSAEFFTEAKAVVIQFPS